MTRWSHQWYANEVKNVLFSTTELRFSSAIGIARRLSVCLAVWMCVCKPLKVKNRWSDCHDIWWIDYLGCLVGKLFKSKWSYRRFVTWVKKCDFWSKNLNSKTTGQIGLKFGWNFLQGVFTKNCSWYDGPISDMQIRAKNVSFWSKIYNSKTTEQIGLKFNGNASRDVWTKKY